MTRRPGPCPTALAWCPSGPDSSAAPPSRRRLAIASAANARFLGRLRCRTLPLLALLATALVLPSVAAHAGVRFENCVQGSDGSLSCDTVPTGNTYLNDKDAQYGLLQQASPGWAEFNPYQGYDEDFGGGED